MSAKTNQLSDRLLDFAVEVIKITDALPNTVTGRHVGGQLIRAGTSCGSNYEEACGAESRSDFCAQDEYCAQRTEGITILVEVNLQNGNAYH